MSNQTDAATAAMNDLIRRAAGRPPAEPEEPASPNGRGDGGKTGPQDAERRSPAAAMNDRIRDAFWRRWAGGAA